MGLPMCRLVLWRLNPVSGCSPQGCSVAGAGPATYGLQGIGEIFYVKEALTAAPRAPGQMQMTQLLPQTPVLKAGFLPRQTRGECVYILEGARRWHNRLSAHVLTGSSSNPWPSPDPPLSSLCSSCPFSHLLLSLPSFSSSPPRGEAVPKLDVRGCSAFSPCCLPAGPVEPLGECVKGSTPAPTLRACPSLNQELGRGGGGLMESSCSL